MKFNPSSPNFVRGVIGVGGGGGCGGCGGSGDDDDWNIEQTLKREIDLEGERERIYHRIG